VSGCDSSPRLLPLLVLPKWPGDNGILLRTMCHILVSVHCDSQGSRPTRTELREWETNCSVDGWEKGLYPFSYFSLAPLTNMLMGVTATENGH
jgi:hypothetical protein